MICGFRCPYCGDEMTYDMNSHKLVCGACNSTVEPSNYDYSNLIYPGTEKLPEEFGGFSCPYCGSKIYLSGVEANVTCSFCGSEMVAFGLGKDELCPERILPFKLNQKDALGKVMTWWYSKKTMPKFLPEKYGMTLEELYIPVWLFDSKVYTCMDALVAPFENEKDRVDGKTYSHVLHKGILSEFVGIPLDGSAHVMDERFKGIEPFEFGDMIGFNPSYLAGHKTERYYYSQYDLMPEIINRLSKYGKEQCTALIENDVWGGTILNSTVTNLDVIPQRVTYALVPAWICDFVYKNKRYQIFVNGATGKTEGDVIFADHKFAKNIGLFSLVSLVSSTSIAYLAFFILGRFGKILTIRSRLGIIAISILVYVILVVVFTFNGFMEEKLQRTVVGAYVDEETQIKQGKQITVKGAISTRGMIAAIIFSFLVIFSLATKKGLFFKEFFMVGIAGLAIAFSDTLLFAKKYKWFLKRKKTVDYTHYVKTASVREIEKWVKK